MVDSNFNKLPFNGGYFMILTKWGTENVEVFIHETKHKKTFRGSLELTEMEEASKELEIPFQDFHKECRNALTTLYGLASFKYDLNMEQKRLLLIKKDVHTIIQYLDIGIIEDLGFTSQMLDAANDFINVQKQQTLELLKVKAELEKRYKETRDSFERCLKEKNAMERNLMKKFSVLLNSKKAKITELLIKIDQKVKEQHEDFNDFGSSDEEPSTSDVARKQIKGKGNKTKVLNISIENYHSNDDDFLAPTQLMTLRETAAKNMPKRRKTEEDDSAGITEAERD